MEKSEPSYIAGRNGAAALENIWLLQKLNIELPYDATIPLLDICKRNET